MVCFFPPNSVSRSRFSEYHLSDRSLSFRLSNLLNTTLVQLNGLFAGCKKVHTRPEISFGTFLVLHLHYATLTSRIGHARRYGANCIYNSNTKQDPSVSFSLFLPVPLSLSLFRRTIFLLKTAHLPRSDY